MKIDLRAANNMAKRKLTDCEQQEQVISVMHSISIVSHKIHWNPIVDAAKANTAHTNEVFNLQWSGWWIV